MFHKSQRLNNNSEIKKTIEKGLLFKSPMFVLKYLPWENLKIGVIIGKKISKSAVIRNRVKRIFRAAIRKLIKDLNVKWRLVFFPNINTVSLKMTDLLPSVSNVFNQINKRKWEKKY